MNSLDEQLLQFVQETFDREQLTFMLTVQQLERRGFDLKGKQLISLREQIAKSLANNSGDTLTLDIEIEDGKKESTLIELVAEDEDYQILEGKVDSLIGQTIQRVISELAEDLAGEWKKQVVNVLSEYKSVQETFDEKMSSIWGDALDLLKLLSIASLDAGSKFNKEYSQHAEETNDLIFGILKRLHARGCQVAEEINILLSNGFADGAHARWRTLHEISIIASFIKEHGIEVAERYISHYRIEIYQEALAHREHHKALGWQPITDEQLEPLKAHYDRLLKHFGNDFKSDYGWASEVLKKRRPNFYDIEKNAGLEHVRPFVKMASLNVHASAKSIKDRLGLIPDMDIMVAGPSVYGLGHPARNTASSLTLLTTIFLLLKPNVENLVCVKALQELNLQIHNAFYEAENKLGSK